MKSPIIRLTCLALSFSVALAFPLSSHAQLDPALTAAVIGQTTTLHKDYKERSKLQEGILAAEGTISLTMKAVHNIEDKVLNYLSNAQGAVQNLHQIKRAGELAIIEIPRNLAALGKAVPKHVKGTAIAAIVSDEIKNTYEDAITLYPLIAQLVSSGSYNVETAEGTTEKKKVNLLNAAERYYIANEVVSRLERINMNLFLLTWQVQSLNFNDLFFHLAPESWCNIMAGKLMVEEIIREYSYL